MVFRWSWQATISSESCTAAELPLLRVMMMHVWWVQTCYHLASCKRTTRLQVASNQNPRGARHDHQQYISQPRTCISQSCLVQLSSGVESAARGAPEKPRLFLKLSQLPAALVARFAVIMKGMKCRARSLHLCCGVSHAANSISL